MTICHLEVTVLEEWRMNNLFWLIGVIVVVLLVLGFFGLR